MENTADGRANARSSDVAVAHKIPLLFEPDQGWVYGYGIDWAGLAVMRATGYTLEEYMTRHIWGPLGMASTTFSLADHRPDLLPRFAAMTLRDDGGALEVSDHDMYSHRAERVKYGGGGGCLSTANDYVKFLSSLLNTATGSAAKLPQLLSRDTVKGMFAPRLTAAAENMLRRTIDSPLAFGLAGDLPRSVRASFGLGGLLTLSAVPATGRSPGGMQWGGLPNLFWWVSPADNRCGCYFGQLLPPGDHTSFRLYEGFERAVLADKNGKEKL
jgi:CubicO group peptidase (beta-lactamase class C family)